MTIELDVSVAAWPIAYDVVVQPGPVLIDVAIDARPIVVVVGQLFPDIHVPADLGDWQDFAPHGVGAGVNIKVPFDATAMAGFAPSIQIGVRIAAPVDGLLWEDVAPAVYIGGVRVAIPVDAAEVAEFAPTIQTGINLDMPFDLAGWTDRAPAVGYGINLFVPADAVATQDYAPLILTGVRLAVPGDAVEWTDFSPSLSIVVDVPSDAMVMADFVPAVAAGMSVAVPSDGMTWADYEPKLDRFDFNDDFNDDFNAVPHGENLAIPADAMSWADNTPAVEAQAAVTSVSLFASEAPNFGSNITWPAGIQAGDVAVLFLGPSSPLSGGNIPAPGFQLLATDQAEGTGGINIQGYSAYRILDGSESGTLTTVASFRALLIFRGDVPITAVAHSTWTAQATAGNATSRTISASSAGVPVVAIAWIFQGSGLGSRAFSTQSPTFAATVPGDYHLTGYTIYNSSPVNHTVDINDAGDYNFMTTGWLSFS